MVQQCVFGDVGNEFLKCRFYEFQVCKCNFECKHFKNGATVDRPIKCNF